MQERLAIVGSGAIACGLAATAAHHGPVLLLARSSSSAERARATVEKTLSRLRAEVDPEHVQVVTDPRALARGDVRRGGRDRGPRGQGRRPRGAARHRRADAILASTTSSLSVRSWPSASGDAERFVGLHVFNPVTKMQLVELIFPSAGQRGDAQPRARAVRDVREDPGRGPGRPGVRGQPAAVPLPVQRGAAAGRDRHGGERDRHLHATRRGSPDGTAGAAGPRRPRRRERDRTDARRAACRRASSS